VKIFTCGPSIYSWPHVGNYRTFLFEDLLLRVLEELGYRVERVINFTDVEDKALTAAAREGRTMAGLTEPVAKRFQQEAELLAIKLPGFVPRSSTSVEEAVHLIQVLIGNGHAYRQGKDVFFDPLTYPGFGRLYGLDMSRWPREKRRFRKDTYPGQRWNLGDFILWHGCRREDRVEGFCWETALGPGRPSWNIQDPAIIHKHLGDQIDIACGGVDNLFRHHDYNLAVMESFSGKEFARYWLHGGYVLLNGVKMSKSRGNIVYPADLLAKGLTPQHLRFALIDCHYREKLDLNDAYLEQARDRLDRLHGLIGELEKPSNPRQQTKPDQPSVRLHEAVMERLADDLDVPGAVAALEGMLAALVARKERHGWSGEEASEVRRQVERIDGVLKVLVPAAPLQAS
ncbi:MAG: class I tRNA ligase family protein, partial [Desulfobacteraceae bacterium]|nr:class I tRNA ligase family protein [Desulfobacteraceae bacterium]